MLPLCCAVQPFTIEMLLMDDGVEQKRQSLKQKLIGRLVGFLAQKGEQVKVYLRS